MILSQSLHLEVNRGNHGQASASGATMISAARDVAATYDRLPRFRFGLFPHAAGRPM
jgi:hypothetical protein